MESLGTIPDKAGKFGVLRVLASYPAMPHDLTLKQAIENDQCKHPGATLDMASDLLKDLAKVHIQCLGQQVVQAMQRKGKAEDEQRKRKAEEKMRQRKGEDEAMPEDERMLEDEKVPEDERMVED